MKIELNSRQLMAFIKGIVIFNIFFLAGTYIFHFYLYKILDGNWEIGSSIKLLLVEFSLANENVLATWYSSMLFLCVGIFCFICYLIQKKTSQRRREKNLSYGWLIFSAIFALLSLDEMVSLHERLGNIRALNPFGDYPLGWIFLLAIPIVLATIFMLLFCLLQVKKAPMAAIFAIIGILLFASIPVQEYFEVKAWNVAEDMSTWQRPVIFLIIEEASELFGATFIIIGTIIFSGYETPSGRKPSLNSKIKLDLNLNKKHTAYRSAAGFIFLALLMTVIVNNELLFLEGDHGKRENWFPAATAFLSSLLCLYLYFQEKKLNTNSQKIFLKIALLSLFISAYFGGNLYAYMYNPKGTALKIIFLIILSLFTLALAYRLYQTFKDIYCRTATIAWALLLICAFGIFSWYAAAFAFVAYTLLFISLLYKITSEVTVTTSLPTLENKIL